MWIPILVMPYLLSEADIHFESMGLAAWVTGISVLLTAIGAFYVTITQNNAKIKTESQQRKIDHNERIVERLERQNNRQGKQIAEASENIHLLYIANTRCEKEASEVYGWLRTFRDKAVHLSEEIAKLQGTKPEEIPELPERKSSVLDSAEAEFILRTSTHNKEMLDDLDKEEKSASK